MAPVFLGAGTGNYLLHNDPFILIDGKENELSQILLKVQNPKG